jgi:tetratricopeptide (TPR) repeat protein
MRQRTPSNTQLPVLRSPPPPPELDQELDQEPDQDLADDDLSLIESRWRDAGFIDDTDASSPAPLPTDAPLSPPPDLAAAVSSSHALLQEMRDLMTEARTAGAQTEYALRAIADEVRNIGARHQLYERKYVFSSVASYLLFCTLIFGLVYFIFSARTSTETLDVQLYENELKLLSQRLQMTEAELKKFNDAARVANEIYQLIEQGMYEVALDRFIKHGDRIVNRTEFSLLREKVENLKWKLAEDAYHKGVEQFTQEDYERARETFLLSLSYQSETPHSSMLNYYLGMSLYVLRDFEGSRQRLEQALSGPLAREHQDNARYHRAAATEAVGEVDEAYNLYTEYLTFHRGGKYGDTVVQIRDRIDRRRLLDQKALERAERERKQRLRDEAEAAKTAP